MTFSTFSGPFLIFGLQFCAGNYLLAICQIPIMFLLFYYVIAVGRGEKLPVSQGAGLTAKGRARYNAATGSNLKAPAPSPKTKADAGRKKSFCARMSGMPGPMKDEKGRPTRKAASLKRWGCK